MTPLETATTPKPTLPAPFSAEAEALGAEYAAAITFHDNIFMVMDSLDKQGRIEAAAALIPALSDARENMMRLHRLVFPIIQEELELALLALKAGN